MRQSQNDRYYPVLINLSGKACLVIGGGRVAERKVRSLLKAGADVTVISPEVTEGIKRLYERGRIRLLQRRFRKGDLKKAFLVIAATSSAELHKRIAEDFKGLINVVDKPELCNFIVPSVVKRGPLILAISTSGASPAMAKAIRKELEGLYGKGFGDYLEFLREIRPVLVSLREREKKGLIKTFTNKEVLKRLRGKEASQFIKEMKRLFKDLLGAKHLRERRS